jgi:hypothetical protein
VPRELVIPESCLDKKTYSMSIHAPLSKNYTDRYQEFTMAMMLRTLNVDLDIIGYDREQQRWID